MNPNHATFELTIRPPGYAEPYRQTIRLSSDIWNQSFAPLPPNREINPQQASDAAVMQGMRRMVANGISDQFADTVLKMVAAHDTQHGYEGKRDDRPWDSIDRNGRWNIEGIFHTRDGLSCSDRVPRNPPQRIRRHCMERPAPYVAADDFGPLALRKSYREYEIESVTYGTEDGPPVAHYREIFVTPPHSPPPAPPASAATAPSPPLAAPEAPLSTGIPAVTARSPLPPSPPATPL